MARVEVKQLATLLPVMLAVPKFKLYKAGGATQRRKDVKSCSVIKVLDVGEDTVEEDGGFSHVYLLGCCVSVHRTNVS